MQILCRDNPAQPERAKTGMGAPSKMTQDHAAEQEWIEKMWQFQIKPAPVEFIPVSPSTLPEIEHPYQLSGPEWEPPTPW